MENKIKITTLTPVHIGSGNKYPMNIEVIYDGERLGVLSPEKVVRKIGVDNILKWTSVIEKEENVWGFLQRFGVSDIDDVCKRSMDVYGSNISRKKDLKELLMSARGYPLLPGSSIKGAIRTAILSYLINKNDSTAKNVLYEYKKRIPSYKWNLRDFQKIESLIANLYFNGTDKTNANKDVLRFLQITDAEFNYETIATNVKILNLERNGWAFKHSGDQITEAIGIDCQSEIRIKINDRLLKKNLEEYKLSKNIDTSYLFSFEKLFGIINAHTQKLISKEIDLWEDEIEKSDITNNIMDAVSQYLEGLKKINEAFSGIDKSTTCILRIGGNTGWDFITGAWIKNKTTLLSDDEWWNLYKQLNKNRNVDIFPKTRKLDEDGDFFGFVKLEMRRN